MLVPTSICTRLRHAAGGGGAGEGAKHIAQLLPPVPLLSPTTPGHRWGPLRGCTIASVLPQHESKLLSLLAARPLAEPSLPIPASSSLRWVCLSVCLPASRTVPLLTARPSPLFLEMATSPLQEQSQNSSLSTETGHHFISGLEWEIGAWDERIE